MHGFALAIKKLDWKRAAELLREEMAIRKKITPEALIPETERLIEQAEKEGCGARFAGAGAGGSIWAIGDTEKIDNLRNTWGKTLSEIGGGNIIDCHVEPEGLK